MMVLGGVAPADRTEPSLFRRWPLHPQPSSVAGPLLIAAVVVVLLHDVVFGGMVSDRNPDLLAFWMPNQCFLGQELAAGRIPYWNPHLFAGTPFAADPQSGWMYLPMMLLGALPCDVALRALVVFFPLLAGLGGYAFLRVEGASRVAATFTGVVLAGVTAGTALAVTLTFVGFVAWTPWMLATASRALGATTWGGRLGWTTAMALAWGQLAAAHISNGLVMGSVLLAAFWVYRSTREVRDRRLSVRAAIGFAIVATVLLIAVNLAYLLPRLIYLDRSTIGLGYEGLFELRNELWGINRVRPPPVRVTEAQWILRLATTPGAYLAAVPLAVSFAGLFLRRWRGLALLLWVYVVAFYVIGIRAVADVLQSVIGDTFLGDFYGHAPARFGYAPLLGLCLLVGLGVEAVREQRSNARRAAFLAPGLLLWGLVPLVAGAEPGRMWLFAAGAAAAFAAAVVVTAVRRPALLWPVLAVVVAAELGVNGLYGQRGVWEPGDQGLTDPTIVGVEPLPEPHIDPELFAAELPTLAGLDAPPDERWITFGPSLQILGRQMIHGVNEAQGYNPVQLRRYWTYSRALGPRGVEGRPRVTIFRRLPDRGALDLLGVHYISAEVPAETEVRSVDGFELVSEDDGWQVWEVADPAPAAAAYASYQLLPTSQQNLDAVVGPGSSDDSLVVERSGVSAEVSHAPAQSAAVRWIDPSTVEVEVDPDMHRYLLVRVPYDDYWTAEIDGRTAEVFPANYFLQAVEVRRGDRIVRLTYRDPWVAWGLWASAACLAAIAAALLLLLRKRGDALGPASG